MQAEVLIKAARKREGKWPDAVAMHSAPIMYACDGYPELRSVVLDGHRYYPTRTRPAPRPEPQTPHASPNASPKRKTQTRNAKANRKTEPAPSPLPSPSPSPSLPPPPPPSPSPSSSRQLLPQVKGVPGNDGRGAREEQRRRTHAHDGGGARAGNQASSSRHWSSTAPLTLSALTLSVLNLSVLTHPPTLALSCATTRSSPSCC
jgi:hypothetical protein